MVNALVSVDGVELVGELQLTTLEYLELRGGAEFPLKFCSIEARPPRKFAITVDPRSTSQYTWIYGHYLVKKFDFVLRREDRIAAVRSLHFWRN